VSAGWDTPTNGALTGAASFEVRAGGTLSLSNGTANTRANSDRIGDTTPVAVRSANFTLTGSAASGRGRVQPCQCH